MEWEAAVVAWLIGEGRDNERKRKGERGRVPVYDSRSDDDRKRRWGRKKGDSRTHRFIRFSDPTSLEQSSSSHPSTSKDLSRGHGGHPFYINVEDIACPLRRTSTKLACEAIVVYRACRLPRNTDFWPTSRWGVFVFGCTYSRSRKGSPKFKRENMA